MPFIAIGADPFNKITTDEFIDVLIGTRKYMPCLCTYLTVFYQARHIYFYR